MSRSAAAPAQHTIPMFPIGVIHLSPTNPRKVIDENKLAELTASVRDKGVLQPLLLRPHPSIAGEFELVCGERRWRAACAAELAEVPGVVRDLDDATALEAQVVENGQRADVHPLEEADAFQALISTHKRSVDDVAAKVGKSRAYVYQRLRFCTLVDSARQLFLDGRITAAGALTIARIANNKLQTQAVAELARYIRGGDDVIDVRSVRDVVERRFMLRLDGAPFATADADLVPAASSCTACPKRSGNQRELFDAEDDAPDDLCLDPDCFEKKKEADWKQKAKAAKKTKQPVLDEAATKKVYPWGHDQMSSAASYVDLSAECTEDPKRRTWKELLTPVLAERPATLAKAPSGRAVELFDRKLAGEALKKLHPVLVEKRKAAKQADPRRFENARKLREDRIKRAGTVGAMMALVERVSKVDADRIGGDGKILRFLVESFLGTSWHDVLVEVCSRRGLDFVKQQYTGKKGDTADQALRKLAAKLDGGPLFALVVEVLATRGSYGYGQGEMLKKACAVFGVDDKAARKKAEGALREELRAKDEEKKQREKKKASKAAPAAKKKGAPAKEKKAPVEPEPIFDEDDGDEE